MIGENIKSIRKSKGISQEELAKMIGVTGPTVTRYERSDREPKKGMLEKIATALNCTVADLYGWDDIFNSEQLSKDVKTIEIIKKYETLNELGKNKAKDYIDDLAEQDKYTNKVGE